MHSKEQFLFRWAFANILALPLGWVASETIKPPFGKWAYGGIIIVLLVLAFRHQGIQVTRWAIWWSMGSLIIGFEAPLRISVSSPLQAIVVSVATMLVMVVTLLIISLPLGVAWLLKVFVEPHPGEPPRRQLLVGYIKATAKVIMVWCSVCVAGAVLGVAIGMTSRGVGEIWGWTTTMEFNVGARAVFGAIGGMITGLALIRASRYSVSSVQD